MRYSNATIIASPDMKDFCTVYTKNLFVEYDETNHATPTIKLLQTFREIEHHTNCRLTKGDIILIPMGSYKVIDIQYLEKAPKYAMLTCVEDHTINWMQYFTTYTDEVFEQVSVSNISPVLRYHNSWSIHSRFDDHNVDTPEFYLKVTRNTTYGNSFTIAKGTTITCSTGTYIVTDVSYEKKKPRFTICKTIREDLYTVIPA